MRDLLGNPTNASATVVEKGSYISTISISDAKSLNFQYVSPLLTPRLTVLGSLYQFYRFRKLKVTFPPVSNVVLALSYQGTVPYSGPASFSDVSEMQCMSVAWPSGSCTLPSELTIGPRDFSLNEYKWLKTNSGDGEDAVHGILYMARTTTTNTIQYYVRYQYEVEFAGPVAEGKDLREVIARLQEVEQKCETSVGMPSDLVAIEPPSPTASVRSSSTKSSQPKPKLPPGRHPP